MLDLLEDTNEITETLGRSYGLGDEIDDVDLDAVGSHFTLYEHALLNDTLYIVIVL